MKNQIVIEYRKNKHKHRRILTVEIKKDHSIWSICSCGKWSQSKGVWVEMPQGLSKAH